MGVGRPGGTDDFAKRPGARGCLPTRPARVVPRRSRRGGPFTTSGTVLAGVAVIASAVLVPALGKEGSGTAHWRQDFDVATRVAPDPLVSLRTDLLQGAHTPVFVVRSTAAAYWRLTSLQHFDGTSWTGSGSYREVHNRLPGGDVLVGTRQVDETFDIQELGSPWLPVAFRPETVSSGAASYDPASGSLLTRGQTADGETYKVVAAEELAALSPALLDSVRPITAEERSSLAQFLQLPRGSPPASRTFRVPWCLLRRTSTKKHWRYRTSSAVRLSCTPYVLLKEVVAVRWYRSFSGPTLVIASSTPRPTQCWPGWPGCRAGSQWVS